MTIKILDEDVVYFGGAVAGAPLSAGMRISNRLLFGTATEGGGVPTINVLLSGVSPLTLLNAVSLNYIKAFGKCEQDLTPTPASPVDIIANNGAIKAFTGNKWTNVGAAIGYIIQTSSKEIQANSNYTVSAPIFLKAGDYNVSYYTSSTGARPFTIWESNAQGGLIGDTSIFYIGRPDVGTNTGTFTIDRDMYIRISWRNDFTNIVVAPTTAIIYYDGTVETVSIGEGFDSVDGQGTFVSPGSSVTTRIYKTFGQLPNGKYKVAITGNFEFIFQYKDTDSLAPTDYGNIDTWTTSGVYDLDKTGYYYGIAIRYPSNVRITPSEFNGTISLIPLDNPATCQPLLSVGTYKDVQNITNGAITRNVGVVVLDGTETYSIVSSLCRETYNVLSTTLTNKMSHKAENKPVICSHFQSTNNNQSQINAIGQIAFNPNANYSKTCYFSVPTTVTNSAEMQAYMAELAPVIIVYPLATPTTEAVTGQTLTITQGTNIVTAEGSVDDLELEISYKAYAEVTVEEIEAVNTDENVEVTIS